MGDDLSLEGRPWWSPLHVEQEGRPPGSPLHLFLEYLHQFGLENGGATLVVAPQHQVAPQHPIEQFLRYRDELLDWNSRMNLTAITDPEEVLSKHFLDSLSVLQVYDQPRTRLLDIGSGAGFPGLPLKIMRPQWHITLLEATGKKVKFLQHIIETL